MWVFLASDIEGYGTARDVIISALRKLYPLIARPIISVASFLKISGDLARSYSIMIEDYLLRKRKARCSTKQWIYEPYEHVKRFIKNDMKNKKSVIDSISFILRGNNKELLTARLDRFGLITIYDVEPEALVILLQDIIAPYVRTSIKEYEELNEVKRD